MYPPSGGKGENTLLPNKVRKWDKGHDIGFLYISATNIA